MIIFNVDPVSIFKEVIQAIVDDPGFKIGSKEATNALTDANKLQKWCQEPKPSNYRLLNSFAGSLITELDGCIGLRSQVQRINQEKMWESFHKLRTDEAFIKRWKQFLMASVGSESTPILYQNITDRLFRFIIQHKLSVDKCNEKTEVYSPTLSYEEQNALRYAAGYIPRKST